MAKYTQKDRPLVVTTPLEADALLLEKLTGIEAISELFHFQLQMLAEKAVSFDRLMGQGVTVSLTVPGGSQRYVNGIVQRLTQDGTVLADDGKTSFIRYQADVVPRLWLLTKRVQSRVFQGMSVPDILQQVLKQEWQVDVTFQLSDGQPQLQHPRAYCVQYRESDFAFVSRLMEEMGIHYYFVHRDGGHQLVVSSSEKLHPRLPDPSTILFDELTGGAPRPNRIGAWKKTQELCACKVSLWDYTFEMSKKNLASEANILDTVPAGSVQHKLNHQVQINGVSMLEIDDYPGEFAKRYDGVDKNGSVQADELPKVFDDGTATAKIRMEREAQPSLAVEGASNCNHFLPGHLFTLNKHADADGDYLLTRVEHQASLEGAYTAPEGAQVLYENRFRGQPAKLPYRPAPVTPRPTISGTQTAVVVGREGENVFVDKYGRVKVQFHWDRKSKNNEDSSCWLRVAQVWAGNRWGAFFWPRVGQEVVVAFEEGDPDQPIIVGSVYNSQNMPPFEMPDNVLINGFKSCSLGGDPMVHFNGMIFHDELKNEHLQLHSERQLVFSDESRKEQRIGSYSRRVVGGPSLTGSGSGGGGGVAVEEPGWLDDLGSGSGGGSPKYNVDWETVWDGRLGSDMAYGYGQEVAGIMGLKAEVVFGASVTAVLNPIGFLAAFGEPEESPALGTWSSAWRSGVTGFSSLLGGEAYFVVGSHTEAVYGPKVDIHHGASIESSSALSEKTGVALKVGGVLYSGIHLAYLLSPAMGDEGDTLQYVFEGAGALVMGAMLSLDTSLAMAEAAELKTIETNLTNDTITAITKDQVSPATLAAFADAAMRKATAAAASAAAAAITAAKGVSDAALASGAAGTAQQAADNAVKNYNGPFTLTSQDLTLTSSNTAAATTLKLEAVGQGAALPAPTYNGQLDMSANGQVSIACGHIPPGNWSKILLQDNPGMADGIGIYSDYNVRIRRGPAVPLGAPQINVMDQNVTISIPGLTAEGPTIILDGTANTITLKVGPTAGPAQIVLDGTANSVTLSAGPAATGAQLKLTPTTVALTAGGATGCGLNMTTVGPDLTLTCGPESKIDVGAEQITVNCLNLEEQPEVEWIGKVITFAFQNIVELQEQVSLLEAQ